MTLEERAQKARDTLFSRYDVLNALWLNAEGQLTQFHIPCPVYCKYDEHRDPKDGSGAATSKYLSLQKIKGKWRICYGVIYDWDLDPGYAWEVDPGWTPITECSAQVRVEAARHLDKLREQVVKSAEDFITEVDEAIDTLAAAVRHSENIERKDLLAERAKLNGHNK